MIKILVIIVLAILVSPSIYAGSQTGKIELVQVQADGSRYVFMAVGSEHVDRPKCAEDSSWSIRPGKKGKALLDLLLTAYASNSEIAITGYGTCNVHETKEDILTVEFQS